MGDYYTKNPERLQGQPKRTIADYVEQNGILVPRRFDTLAEARRSHRAILLRSEHTQEYDGVSGLLDSLKLSGKYYRIRGSETIEEVKRRYFAKEESKGQTPLYDQYCTFLGIDVEPFKEDISFSVWERLKGINQVVVADSSIAGRYHILTDDAQNKSEIRSYVIVEDRQTTIMFGHVPHEQRDRLQDLIDIYEQIRNLDNFDPNHCPIMEFITLGNKNYFLQYHRTRDFSPSQFVLDRNPINGEVEVPFVRGATIEEGIDCKVTVIYFEDEDWKYNPMEEDGSYDFHWNTVFPEIMARKRKVQITSPRDYNRALSDLTIGHLPRSKIFKPQVSIIHDIDELVTKEDDAKFEKQLANGENAHINLHVTSDGRRAFVRKI